MTETAPPSTNEMERGPRRLVVGLALFRAFVGALVIAGPWLVGSGLDGYGATSVALGVATIAAATQAHRAPWLRWIFLALALAMFFSPFAFSSDDISDHEIYYAVLAGHTLFVSAIVTPRLFAKRGPDAARANASDDASS